MKIALDYDGTYTADPVLWDAFIETAKARGHEVLCVTMRFPHEKVSVPIQVVYTSRRAKKEHLDFMGITVSVWIDDNPHWIFENAC